MERVRAEHKAIKQTMARHMRENKAMMKKMRKHRKTVEHKAVAKAMRKGGHA